MTDHELAHLVERIVATWITGPRGFVWTSYLRKLDHDRAVRTYEVLAPSVERITIARFLDEYDAMLRREQPRDFEHPDYSDAISLDEAIALLDGSAVEGLRKIRARAVGRP